MNQRRPCPNHKCHQWNKLDARFCARCGTPLVDAPAALRPAPHGMFIVIFIGFFLIVFLTLLHAVGPLTLLVLPFVGFGLKWGTSPEHRRRHAPYV